MGRQTSSPCSQDVTVLILALPHLIPWPLLYIQWLTKNQVTFILLFARIHSNMKKVPVRKKKLFLTSVQWFIIDSPKADEDRFNFLYSW